MRKTKIVCTLGPSTDDEAVLRELILSGMNVARLNMSHGTHEEHKRRADMVKKHLFQGHELDKAHLAKELGDVLWYLTAATMAKGLTLEELWQYNVEKLEGRYGELREREG